MHALLTIATTEGAEETSKTLFYVLGSALAVFAVLLSGLGMSRPDFPGTDGAARATIGTAVVLVVAAMAAVIITA
ncbi:hypothetical protein GKE82_12055 [Conexibacter sp. W3-3-2]|uniref:Uncharacterized protein n=1 Tax=Paraconexibacter algicola TaxID=2133960 RepID=A0A2T4UHI6_9ACTN|nr:MULTISPECIES: hypothetical protein [Solirubrobacterales]MTD45003.1 hypothetical protein [Conexibacter sp. W3-3-2]PTL58706.1 hypothetical protein C7Y72_03095 [Paraconexibacter algicola]